MSSRKKGISEFAFVMQPLKIQGGTGSTVSPGRDEVDA